MVSDIHWGPWYVFPQIRGDNCITNMGEWRDKNVTSITKREEGGTLHWGRLGFPLQIFVHPECDLIWGNYLKMRWALNPKTGVLLRRGEDTQTHRTASEDGRIGWASTSWGVARTAGSPRKRGQTDGTVSLRTSRKNRPWQHLDFRHLASRAVREYMNIVLSHWAWSPFLWQP